MCEFSCYADHFLFFLSRAVKRRGHAPSGRGQVVRRICRGPPPPVQQLHIAVLLRQPSRLVRGRAPSPLAAQIPI
eukprot:scaffold205873_cov30-Tisochrysis_lutea.AAC.1